MKNGAIFLPLALVLAGVAACGEAPPSLSLHLSIPQALQTTLTRVEIGVFGSHTSCATLMNSIEGTGIDLDDPLCEGGAVESGECPILRRVFDLTGETRVTSDTLYVSEGTRFVFALGWEGIFDVADACEEVEIRDGYAASVELTLSRYLW